MKSVSFHPSDGRRNHHDLRAKSETTSFLPLLLPQEGQQTGGDLYVVTAKTHFKHDNFSFSMHHVRRQSLLVSKLTTDYHWMCPLKSNQYTLLPQRHQLSTNSCEGPSARNEGIFQPVSIAGTNIEKLTVSKLFVTLPVITTVNW